MAIMESIPEQNDLAERLLNDPQMDFVEGLLAVIDTGKDIVAYLDKFAPL
jgi:hypothetical protein